MTSPPPEATPEAGGNTRGSKLLRVTLIVALVLYGGLLACSCVPFIGMFVFIFAFFVFYLWVYVGASAAMVAFTAAFFASRNVFHKRSHRLQFAVQLSAIAFAVVGIPLMAMVPLLPGQNLHMAGYSLHTRIWLDADKVRGWANNLDIPADSDISWGPESPTSRTRWPLTLQIMAGLTGRVQVDETTREVTLVHGGALSGHWGVHIAARDQDWAGPRKDCWIKKLDDGVWIWSTPD